MYKYVAVDMYATLFLENLFLCFCCMSFFPLFFFLFFPFSSYFLIRLTIFLYFNVSPGLLVCMSCLSYPVRWHGIAFNCLISWLHESLHCSLWPQSLYFSRMKNQQGHWVGWMPTGRKNGLMCITHKHTRAAMPLDIWSCAIFLLVSKLYDSHTLCCHCQRPN